MVPCKLSKECRRQFILKNKFLINNLKKHNWLRIKNNACKYTMIFEILQWIQEFRRGIINKNNYNNNYYSNNNNKNNSNNNYCSNNNFNNNFNNNNNYKSNYYNNINYYNNNQQKQLQLQLHYNYYKKKILHKI